MSAVSFGDFDPEDAWDEGDAWPVRRELAGRIVVSIAAEYWSLGPSPRLMARVRGGRRLITGALAAPGLVPLELVYLVALNLVLVELAERLDI